MIVTSSVALLMLRSASGAYQIAKLLTGLISMKWSQLHATLLMDRCNYVNFGQFFFCLFQGQYPFVLLISDGFLMHFWKGALVGSHKGSCRIYKTTGMNFSPLFFSFCVSNVYITLYVMLKLLRLPFFALARTLFGTL